MDIETIKERLKKLSVLADRGTENERVTAKKLLDDLLEKYNLNIDEVCDTSIQRRTIDYKGKNELLLMCSIIAHLYGSKSQVYKEARFNKREFVFWTTYVDYEDIRLQFEFYRTKMREDIKDLKKHFFHAFVAKNNLYNITPSGDGSKLTFEDCVKIKGLVDNLSDGIFYKQLNN
jgi:hypothetical protein